jgi:putative DNA primase/helicase
MLSDYAGQVPIQTLMKKHGDGGIPNDLAQLKGLRFVTSSETEEGQRLAEAKIKYLTGTNTIQARYLHQEFFEFPPTHKIFMDANHKPEIRGTDAAIWNRVKLIPFEVTIPPEEIDRELLSKLKRELAGIFAWAVRGAVEWHQHGLAEPAAVCQATAEYREEMNMFAEFVNERCIVGPDCKVSSQELFDAYKYWCETVGEEVPSRKALGARLKSMPGVMSGKDSHGRYWKGIALKPSRGFPVAN